MSYILDALRKADAERERGAVPGIHAQPMFAGAPSASSARATRRWAWMFGAAGIGLVVVAALWWFVFGRGAAAPVAAPTVSALPMPAPVSTPPLAAAPTSPLPASAVAAKSPSAPSTPVARATPKAEAKPVVAPSAAASGGRDNRVYSLSELPDDIRRQLPPVNVGGSMYSATPANRILIINGQVLHEGEAVAPELMLKQIRLKSAMLTFKGYQFLINY